MTVVWGILGLSFLVFFHELGHFFLAQICGVEVEAFSVGMGPVLLHHKWGKTDYRLSLIPVGGYCQMKGEADYKIAIEQNKSEIQSEKDSFYGVSPFRRLLIAFAGPFFNLIFAFFAFVIIAQIGYTYYDAGTKINVQKDDFSPAKEAGLEDGDIITALDGKAVFYFTEIADYVSLRANQDILFTVERGGENLDFVVHSDLNKETGSGRVGIISAGKLDIERQYGGFSFFPSLKEGFFQTISMLDATLKGISSLFKGVKLTSAVSGPARVSTMLGDSVKQGFSVGIKEGIVTTLQFLALISISLFLTNLLPIPVLDGGLILFSLIEGISGKKMHPKLLYYIQFVGIAFIAVLLIIAVTGDINYFFNRWR